MKQSEILGIVRGQIISNKIPPGGRLPTRLELEKKFNASSVTIQKALDQLAQEGFIEAHGRRGTFVSDKPPHLTRYGLVFTSRPPASGDWNRWWQTLENEARVMNEREGLNWVMYYNVDPRVRTGNEYEELAEDVKSHRVAGLLFACHPFIFHNTPVLDHPGVPRIAFTGEPYQPGMGAIQFNGHAQTEKMFGFLRKQGRKKLATLCNASADHQGTDSVKIAKQYGMEARPYWMQGVPLLEPTWGQNVVHLMMTLAPANRPDALWIKDDNLIEHACAGLVDAGVRVGKDLDVVAHCNFPWHTPSILPVKRCGFDAREMLRSAIQFIDGKRRKKRVPTTYVLDAYFEEELPEPATTEEMWPVSAEVE